MSEECIEFEEAYLKWKGIEKPKPLTFDKWFETSYPCCSDEMKEHLRHAWEAAIESVKGENK